MRSVSIYFFGAVLSIVAICNAAIAQTTEFTYQGNLQNASALATGNFDFEFLLFDSLSGGTQLGATLTKSGVAVSTGSFAVKLDFGGNFPGANRFLEIHVRTAGGGAYTTLAPRQSVNSSPYAVKAVNADNAVTATNATSANNSLQLGGLAANQYVLTGDVRLSNARTPTAGSPNYIQNGTGVQASSNFNISGNGTAGGTLSSNIVNAATQYNIGGNRALSNAGLGNLFAGIGAGTPNTGSYNAFFGQSSGSSNTAGSYNAFFGESAGTSNTEGGFGSYFGQGAGSSNTTGGYNSFFGQHAGSSNTTGGSNSFFGQNAGYFNTTGDQSSFFGQNAGFSNTTGGSNAYFGNSTGSSGTTGNGNAFFGNLAGFSNTTGSYNTLIGYGANVSFGNLTNANAIGTQAYVTQNNSLVLGGINGVNGATSNTNVGIGTTAPSKRLVVGGGTGASGVFNNGILVNIPGGAAVTARDSTSGVEVQMNAESNGLGTLGTFTNHPLNIRTNNSEAVRIDTAGNVGIGTSTPNDKLEVNGTIRVATLGGAGSTTLCRNASNQISTCSSSARYKNNIISFSSGLSLIKQLRPVSFNWKDGGMLDMGLVAEEVNAVEPL